MNEDKTPIDRTSSEVNVDQQVRRWLVGDTKLNCGGLMRCCTSTIANYVSIHADEEIEDGFIIDCEYEKAGNRNIILKDNVWRWNKPSA